MVFSLAVEGAGGQADVHDTHHHDGEHDGTGELLQEVLKHVLTLVHLVVVNVCFFDRESPILTTSALPILESIIYIYEIKYTGLLVIFRHVITQKDLLDHILSDIIENLFENDETYVVITLVKLCNETFGVRWHCDSFIHFMI